MASSKTGRAASRAVTGPKGGFQPSGDVPRIVPLDQGRHAYLRDLEGKTVHYSTATDGFIAALVTLDGDGRVTRELAALATRADDAESASWSEIAGRLAAAQAASADGGDSETA